MWWRAPTAAQLAVLLDEEGSSGALTYDQVGATAGDLPEGFRHDRHEVDLGADEDGRFERAAAALSQWAPQRGAGIRVVPDQPVHDAMTFALVLRIGLAYVVAPGRIVAVTSTDDCQGFAYGTLRTHPECGEESFAVRRARGRVRFEIVAFSRPRHPLARLGAPFARLQQRRVTSLYLRAMEHAAR
jgi:uncharacterized protein (UPF0548 family)